jgi:hypothetical protein
VDDDIVNMKDPNCGGSSRLFSFPQRDLHDWEVARLGPKSYPSHMEVMLFLDKKALALS